MSREDELNLFQLLRTRNFVPDLLSDFGASKYFFQDFTVDLKDVKHWFKIHSLGEIGPEDPKVYKTASS